PRLKEWAYAGIFFDLTGAAASHAFSGDPVGKIATPLAFLLLAAASWALRPPSRSWKADSTPAKSAPATLPEHGSTRVSA
ncbi:MAG TPA: DoxX family protein, partial [Polyangiaceae bacterium]